MATLSQIVIFCTDMNVCCTDQYQSVISCFIDVFGALCCYIMNDRLLWPEM